MTGATDTNSGYRLRTYDIVFIDEHNVERSVRYHEYSEHDARKQARLDGAAEILSVRTSK